MSEATVDYNSMPPKVAMAITEVMAEVPKLSKGEKNTHGNYNFASIDDFLEAVRPLCAKSGLIIGMDEEEFSFREGQNATGKKVTWLVVRFKFTLSHSSGETWAREPRRTIMVNAAMGSQAFGAAQSYALKQFERALFQIATGEGGAIDADSNKPEDLPAQDSTPSTISAEQKEQLIRLIQETGTDTAKFLEYLRAPSLDELPATQFQQAKLALEKKAQHD